jgi:PAS domain S-box-containing protein
MDQTPSAMDRPGEPSDERLDASERALLEALLLEAPVAFALYDVDLRWLRINRALAETNGLPMEAHLGRRPSELLPGGLGEAIEANLREVLATGRVIIDDDFTAEAPTTGTLRHWQSQWYPARGPAGEVIGVAVMVTDVTERRRAEAALQRSQVRTERLQQATSALGAALTVGDVARIISALGRTAVGADSSGLSLVLGGPVELAAASSPAAIAGDDGVLSVVRVTAQGTDTVHPVVAEALDTGRPVYVAGPSALPESARGCDVDGFLAGTAERAWAAVPLTSEGATYAVLRFAWRAERELEHEEQVFLEALAGQCSLAIERARLYEREHSTAEALQRSLLPDVLPAVAGVELAATYQPGMEEARVGGDWYDAFALPDGRLAVVVGDVMGKGVTAAAGMGRMRSAVRALAYTDPSPRAVLTGLDRLFQATEGDEQITTLVYAVFEPASGTLVVGNAGHPPLVRTTADGRTGLDAPDGAGTPLGVPEARSDRVLVLEPGDTLLAYTDGLVESRTRGIGEGLEALQDHVRRVFAPEKCPPVRDLVDGAVEAMSGEAGHADDVTVLALRWLGPVG